MKKAGGVLLSVGLCSNLKLRFTAAGIMINIFGYKLTITNATVINFSNLAPFMR